MEGFSFSEPLRQANTAVILHISDYSENMVGFCGHLAGQLTERGFPKSGVHWSRLLNLLTYPYLLPVMVQVAAGC